MRERCFGKLSMTFFFKQLSNSIINNLTNGTHFNLYTSLPASRKQPRP